jgi:gamma-D-glutamyl-L-lysine dipeptidyl-peptidase
MGIMESDAGTSRLVVRVPVADLRRKPADAPLMNVHDDLQETQLLFNEILLLKDAQEGWLRVETVEQRKSSGVGYPGWVRKKDVRDEENPQEYNGFVQSASTVVVAKPASAAVRLFPLSLGTRLLLTGRTARGFLEIALPEDRRGWVPKRDIGKRGATGQEGMEMGRALVGTARLFLNVPYFWGGRSMPMDWSRGPVMGVDCSGLVNLVFRAHDIDVPRDAHEQWLFAEPVDVKELGPGDLIFLSRERNAELVDHVMLFLGGEQFIEAAQTGDTVRIRTFAEKLGLDLGELGQHDFFINKRKVYFGRIRGTCRKECGE